MDLFLLAPAFQAIYGRPMAYIHEKVLAKPSSTFIFGVALFSPTVILIAVIVVFDADPGLIFVLAFFMQIALAPLFYALNAAQRKSQTMDDRDRIIRRYKRRLRRERAETEGPDTTEPQDHSAPTRNPADEQTSVILNKNR
jgi:hypothetical protein